MLPGTLEHVVGLFNVFYFDKISLNMKSLSAVSSVII